MRTTLVISDELFKRAKSYAKKHDKRLSDVFAEAIAERLAREEQALREPKSVYKVVPRSLGPASVDLADREALNRAMDAS
jgi:hypothetical protein